MYYGSCDETQNILRYLNIVKFYFSDQLKSRKKMSDIENILVQVFN